MMRLIAAVLMIPALVSDNKARKIAGVELPNQVVPAEISQSLVLNGVGVRTEFFFDIYVAGLYLPQPEKNAASILKSDVPSRVSMVVVHNVVTKAKLADAWRVGFRSNVLAAQLADMEPRLADFINMFHDLHAGDRVWSDFRPGDGLRVTINEDEKGTVTGQDFNAAVLAVWLGAKPVTQSLKKAMLGG